ncbi:MAG: sensor domain-containing diguanylate cyclase [Gammaproteobacteria bacterium]|nr:MAG: sensor domain-containing diguanylate cyclase [Gammaproteobacteria bacterium]
MNNKKSKSSRKEEKRTLRFILDIIKEGVWDWNANTGNVERSPGWYRMLGYDVDALPKTVFTWEDVIHPDDYPSVMRHFEDYIGGQAQVYEIEYRCRKADGSYIWIRDQGKIVERNGDGSVARMIGAHLNIHDQKQAQLALQHQNELLNEDKFTLENLIDKRTSELEEVNRKLKENLKKIDQLSKTDALTSIYNRHKLETELGHEIARSKRYKTSLSVALFDVDNFKAINDTHGHQMGDQVLKRISELIIKNTRDTDIIGRWGGDEFLIILPGINLDNAISVMEKIRGMIAAPDFFESITVTCSFGVTQHIPDDSIGSMYKRADVALYRAKSAGRNIVMRYRY